jgi:5'-nucleotidase
VVAGLLEAILAQDRFPVDTLLSVNLPPVPPDEVKGVRVTSLGRRRYPESITRAKDPSGREYFWIGGGVSEWKGSPDSDFRAINEGFVSVTPLHLDLTNYSLIEDIRAWRLEL